MWETERPGIGPCSVCGRDTVMCCSDCAIERGATVYVCPRFDCMDKHEKANPQHPKVEMTK
jgi:hypothetical protein